MDYDYEYGSRITRNPMATAAIVLGIISVLACLFFYISLPCGALAILCAILSRGRNPMPGRSKAGFICGIWGILLSISLVISSVWMMLTRPDMRAYLEYYMQYYLGDPEFDLEQELENAFPALRYVFGDTADESEDNVSEDISEGEYLFNDIHEEEDIFNDIIKEDNTADKIPPQSPSRQLPEGEGVFI